MQRNGPRQLPALRCLEVNHAPVTVRLCAPVKHLSSMASNRAIDCISCDHSMLDGRVNMDSRNECNESEVKVPIIHPYLGAYSNGFMEGFLPCTDISVSLSALVAMVAERVNAIALNSNAIANRVNAMEAARTTVVGSTECSSHL
ncbi:hypothetical protein CLF_111113 [Clonorchis sinensis]|uniref:Uncharacterized protein n=1 Tax=Clonorchis sinensis TaxID=79923 RepID=G7YUD6_CLOSI|nr:hypothetical protein CLF_111113 [Clonorchis sinensis]